MLINGVPAHLASYSYYNKETVEAIKGEVLKVINRKNRREKTKEVELLRRVHKSICQYYQHLAKGTISIATGWHKFSNELYKDWQRHQNVPNGMSEHIARCICIFFSAIRNLDKGERWHERDQQINGKTIFDTEPQGKHTSGYTGCSYEDISSFDNRRRCLGGYLGQLVKEIGSSKQSKRSYENTYMEEFTILETNLSNMYEHITSIWKELRHLIKSSRKVRVNFQIKLLEDQGWLIDVNGAMCLPGNGDNNLMNTSLPMWDAHTWNLVLTFGNNIGAANVSTVDVLLDAEDLAKGIVNKPAPTANGANRKRLANESKKAKASKKSKSVKKSKISKAPTAKAEEDTDDEDFSGGTLTAQKAKFRFGEDDSEDEAVPKKKQKSKHSVHPKTNQKSAAPTFRCPNRQKTSLSSSNNVDGKIEKHNVSSNNNVDGKPAKHKPNRLGERLNRDDYEPLLGAKAGTYRCVSAKEGCHLIKSLDDLDYVPSLLMHSSQYIWKQLVKYLPGRKLRVGVIDCQTNSFGKEVDQRVQHSKDNCVTVLLVLQGEYQTLSINDKIQPGDMYFADVGSDLIDSLTSRAESKLMVFHYFVPSHLDQLGQLSQQIAPSRKEMLEKIRFGFGNTGLIVTNMSNASGDSNFHYHLVPRYSKTIVTHSVRLSTSFKEAIEVHLGQQLHHTTAKMVKEEMGPLDNGFQEDSQLSNCLGKCEKIIRGRYQAFKLSVIALNPQARFEYGIGYGWDPKEFCTLFMHNPYHPTIPSYERGSNNSFVCMTVGLDSKKLGNIGPCVYSATISDYDPYLEQKTLCPETKGIVKSFSMPRTDWRKNTIGLTEEEKAGVPQLDYPIELSPQNWTEFRGLELFQISADILKKLKGGEYLCDEMMMFLTLGPRLRARREATPKTIHITSLTVRLIQNGEHNQVRKYINKFHKNAKLSSIFDLDLVFMHFCCRRHWIVAIVVQAGLVLKGKIGQSGILFMDSLNWHNDQINLIKPIIAWLNNESRHVNKDAEDPFSENTMNFWHMKMNKQKDGTSCLIEASTYSNACAQYADVIFSQVNIESDFVDIPKLDYFKQIDVPTFRARCGEIIERMLLNLMKKEGDDSHDIIETPSPNELKFKNEWEQSVYQHFKLKPQKQKAERKEKQKAERDDKRKAEHKEKQKAEQEAKEKDEREEKRKAERKEMQKAEREAKEKAERKEKQKAEREALKQKAERKEMQKAEREAKEEAEREALKQKAERKEKQKAEREALKQKAERKEKQKAEREAKEEAEREALKQKAEREAKEEAQREALKQKAERKEKQKAEREAKEEAEREALKQKAERKEMQKAEREAKEEAQREALKQKAERKEKQKAEREAKEEAEREALKQKAERKEMQKAEREAKEEAQREALKQKAERKEKQKAEREAKEEAECVATKKAEREEKQNVWQLFGKMSTRAKALINPKKRQKNKTNKGSSKCERKFTNSFEEFQHERIRTLHRYNCDIVQYTNGTAKRHSGQIKQSDYRPWTKHARATKLMSGLAFMRTQKRSSEDEVNPKLVEWCFLYGRLESFLDFGPETDLRMSCFSQMSSSVVFFPCIEQCPAIQEILGMLFDAEAFNLSNTGLLLMVHGSTPSDGECIEGALMEGAMSFLNEYTVVAGVAFSFQNTGSEVNTRSLFIDKYSYDEYSGCGDCCEYLVSLVQGYVCHRFCSNSPGSTVRLQMDKKKTLQFNSENFYHDQFKPNPIGASDLLRTLIQTRSNTKIGKNRQRSSIEYLWIMRQMGKVLFTRGVIRECTTHKAMKSLCVSVGALLQSIFDHSLQDPSTLVDWGNSLLLERVCVSSIIIYKNQLGYRLGCTCCGKDVHVNDKGYFPTFHDAMKEAPYSAVVHRIATGIAEDHAEDSPRNFTYPYRLTSMDIVKNNDISPCNRDFTKHDSCLGNDQLILSSILNEKNLKGGRAQHLWGDVVDGAFICSVESHQKFQREFEKILANKSTVDQVSKVLTVDRSIIIKKNAARDRTWQPSEFELSSVLQTYISSVMLVDWCHPSLPKTVPGDFDVISCPDKEILSNILSGADRFEFFHQTGMLPLYLMSASENSVTAATYRKLSKVACAYAFQCGNRCENVFTQGGRETKLSQKLYILRSIVPTAAIGEDRVIEDSYLDMQKLAGDMLQIDWVAEDSLLGRIESSFFHSLKHGAWCDVPSDVLMAVKQSVESDQCKPRSFTVCTLSPYQVRMQVEKETTGGSTIGLADTQLAISSAFCDGSIPQGKALEKVTSACFQLGSKNVDYAMTLWKKTTENSRVASRRLSQSTLSRVRREPESRSDCILMNVESNEGASLPVKTSPPECLHGSAKFPVQVHRFLWNCAQGNAANLMHAIGHYDEMMKKLLLSACWQENRSDLCRSTDYERLTCNRPSVQLFHNLKKGGYTAIKLPSGLDYEALTYWMKEIPLPILVSLRIAGVDFEHVIGLCPYRSTPGSNVQFQIIDGAHPSMRPIEFSLYNLEWCCGGKFTTTTSGFIFLPGRKRTRNLIDSSATSWGRDTSFSNYSVCLDAKGGHKYSEWNVVTENISEYERRAKKMMENSCVMRNGIWYAKGDVTK